MTSEASTEIARMYETMGGICLSANFDDYITFALTDSEGKGIPILERELAERYFKRNRRGSRPFEDKPNNRCVLHANGDVFWLYCSGNKGEGYCPETGKKEPAFYHQALHGKEDMICKFCKSDLLVTMTMPGTYEKDYNTRAIITTIWKYLSTKISAVITVGLSCNWDDVLLKFVLQLINERGIPLLDINNLSDQANEGKTSIVEKIVKGSRLEACSYTIAAADGVRKLNELAVKNSVSYTEPALEEDYQAQLIRALESTKEISRLKTVSQLGLKSFWMESKGENERWSHSIEVAEIVVQMYKRLCKNSNKKESAFEQVLLYASGLLHDCGHLPFSHLLEDVFEELSWHLSGEQEAFKHSHYSKRVIEKLVNDETCGLKEILDRYHVSVDEVVACVNGDYGVNYIDALINSAIDADKIAYIFTDAENTQKNLMMDRDGFLEKLLERAYITQEGLIALDGQSAWYAMRLLDERQRMYQELYYGTRIRYLEAAVKYIITTYFVQKYNNYELLEMEGRRGEDLGDSHILMAIEDIYEMIEDSEQYRIEDLSRSMSREVKDCVKECMKLAVESGKAEEEPKEIIILRCMYEQLIGEKFERKTVNIEKEREIQPYQDTLLERMTDSLDYDQLNAVRKKIILNYPGTVLIDVYTPTRYFSAPASRRRRPRIDGTTCGQEMILVPDGDRSTWSLQNSQAEVGLIEYSQRVQKEKAKAVFQVFKIAEDSALCEHVINMLKKELESARR